MDYRCGHQPCLPCHALLQCASSASPSDRWGPCLCPLNLGWACGSANATVAGRGLQRACILGPVLSRCSWKPWDRGQVNKAGPPCDDRPVAKSPQGPQLTPGQPPRCEQGQPRPRSPSRAQSRLQKPARTVQLKRTALLAHRITRNSQNVWFASSH